MDNRIDVIFIDINTEEIILASECPAFPDYRYDDVISICTMPKDGYKDYRIKIIKNRIAGSLSSEYSTKYQVYIYIELLDD